MIARLRGRHRAASLALAVVVPAGMLLGLTSREPVPFVETPPGAVAGAGSGEGSRDGSGSADGWSAFEGIALEARVVDGVLEIRATAPTARPDVLIYRAAGDSVEGRLPSGAILVGALDGADARSFEDSGAGDRLIAWSLARSVVLGTLSLAGEPGEAR